MSNPDRRREIAEARWLQQHPAFEERPATIREFITARYINIESELRPGVLEALVGIFGEEIDPDWISVKRKAVMTGGIGIGKSTFASIALAYMVHWVYCLKDPQRHFGLMAGTQIAFMMMSTSERNAADVVFDAVKQRIENSPWFKQRCPYDPKFTKRMKFNKNLNILPGGSEETQFEGYNILGGILDEGDSHKKTSRKDYADVGLETIESRVESRFMDHQAQKHKGIIIVIGQTKTASGFMSRQLKEVMEDVDGYGMRMSIWESFGWFNYTDNPDDAKNHRETGKRLSFIYDIVRKQIIRKQDAIDEGWWTGVDNETYIEVPNAYIKGFLKNPVKALKDLAGIPPASNDPFISLTHKIVEAQDLWAERMGPASPVDDSSHKPKLADWLHATDRLKRVIHIDLAYSAEGDALGLAMGHVPELIETDEGEEQPLIVFDFLLRIHAAPGTEVIFSDVRRLIYELKQDRKYNVKVICMDGFQSTDFKQQMRKKHFTVEDLSVDKKKGPYQDLQDAIYDGRCLFPKYMTFLDTQSTELVNIAFKELSQLEDVGNKIDHPPSGSKDVADAMAGVTHYLMNDSQFRRGAARKRGAKVPGDQPENIDQFIAAQYDSATSPVSFDVFGQKSAGYGMPTGMPNDSSFAVSWDSLQGGGPDW